MTLRPMAIDATVVVAGDSVAGAEHAGGLRRRGAGGTRVLVVEEKTRVGEAGALGGGDSVAPPAGATLSFWQQRTENDSKITVYSVAPG